MRKIFCDELVKAFAKSKFAFLTGDLGYKALEPLQEVMKDHFINVGIAEQNMVSTAAGIAKTGLPVFVYSIAPFAYARPFEQIRNDVCLHNLPVTIVGNGGGYGYGVMGATHHAIEDYGAMLTLQNMQVFAPVFAGDLSIMIGEIFTQKKPSYLRLGLVEGKCDEVSYKNWRKVLDGENGVVVSFGTIAGKILSDFSKEDKKTRPAIWVISKLPLTGGLPAEFVFEIKLAQKLCVIEEHVEQGGVAQILALELQKQNIALKRFTNFCAVGYSSGTYGSQGFHRLQSGLDGQSILSWLNNA